jgi:allene oxide cyclase
MIFGNLMVTGFRRTRFRDTRVAPVAVGWWGAGLLLALTASPSFATERFLLIESPGPNAPINPAGKGTATGDLLTFAKVLFDATNQVQEGTDQGYCVRVEVGKSMECSCTLILKKGQITIAGPFLDTGDSVLAVTGGTGKYAGARGELKLHRRHTSESSYDLSIELR